MQQVIKTKAGDVTLVGKLSMPSGNSGQRLIYCKALCFCGNIFYPNFFNLKYGKTKSCGCYLIKVTGERSHIHGHATKKCNSKTHITREYQSWTSMTQPCYNPNNTGYK